MSNASSLTQLLQSKCPPKPDYSELKALEKVKSIMLPQDYDGVPPLFELHIGQNVWVVTNASGTGQWLLRVTDIRRAADGFVWVAGNYLLDVKGAITRMPHLSKLCGKDLTFREVIVDTDIYVTPAGSVCSDVIVHDYDDALGVHRRIDPFKDYYTRIAIKGDEVLTPLNLCPICKLPYCPPRDHQRFCVNCSRWLHVDHLKEVKTERRRAFSTQPAQLESRLAAAPIMRGFNAQLKPGALDERWSLVGTGRMKQIVLEELKAHSPHPKNLDDWSSMLQSEVPDAIGLLRYIDGYSLSFYQCPNCKGTI